MSDFQTVRGFEDAWRPPVRPRRRTPQALLLSIGASSGAEVRARLTRLVNRAPEVMIKVTGRTRDAGSLRAHLEYISRNGQLELEDRDGAILTGLAEVKDLAEDWSVMALTDRRRRANSPITLSVMLSMPAGSDPTKVRDAARAFAMTLFAAEHDYVLALHTDAPHPHVHMAICSRGDIGQRLNPKKADLEHWRQVFAQALRDRGVEAEATPRRARGVTHKAELAPLRKIRERHERGQGEIANVRRSAYHSAGRSAFKEEVELEPWERRLTETQGRVRALYLAQAKILQQSSNPVDWVLAEKIETFVGSMPAPDSQRLALARELRALAQALEAKRHSPGPERGALRQ